MESNSALENGAMSSVSAAGDGTADSYQGMSQDPSKGSGADDRLQEENRDTEKEAEHVVPHANRLKRGALYREGLKLQEKDGLTDKALRCYLAAITGLTECEAFPTLPQCLHQIANIYFEKKEYERAVNFIQAEKMYYETALIDIVNLQRNLDNIDDTKTEESGSLQLPDYDENGPIAPEILKAREYEHLAKLCLKESKPQLALEYCGKSTKVYREVYGDAHPVTVGSLDLFTLIYADVGKKLYADAMHKFDMEEQKPDKDVPAESIQTDQVAGQETSSCELRHRITSDAVDSVAKPGVSPTPRTEFEPVPVPDEQDDWVTTCLLMLLFFLVVVLILLVMSYFYCLGNEQSSVCQELKSDLSSLYMRSRHFLAPHRH